MGPKRPSPAGVGVVPEAPRPPVGSVVDGIWLSEPALGRDGVATGDAGDFFFAHAAESSESRLIKSTTRRIVTSGRRAQSAASRKKSLTAAPLGAGDLSTSAGRPQFTSLRVAGAGYSIGAP